MTDTATPEAPPTETTEEPEEVFVPSTADMAISMKKFMLQTVLERAQSVLPSRDVMPVLKNFQVEALTDEAGDSLLKVIATDMELSIVSISQMVTIDRPGTAVFPGKRLLDIVKEAEEGDLVLDVKEGVASIRVGKAEWSLKLMDGSDYPDIPEVEDEALVPIDRSLLYNALNSVRLAAATDTVRPTLMMINISENRVRAADGVRFQQVTLPDDSPIQDMDIPIGAVDDLIKILKTTDQARIDVGMTDNHLIFHVAGDTFIANRVTDEFPEMDDILLKPAMGNKHKLSVDREGLIKAIRRARITADPETNAVILELTDGQCLVRCRDKFGNWALEPIAASWQPATEGDSTRLVALNHVHLTQMLQMTDAKSSEFFLGTDTKNRKSPLLLRDDESRTIGVLTQLRIEWVS